MATHGHTRGGSFSPTYSSWTAMLARCENPKNANFARYGGRGITVCEAWHDFSTFLAAVGERPSREHSIDRIDNDRGYQPGNVRWATSTAQCNNKGNNVRLTHEGRTLTVTEWERDRGLSAGTISNRIYHGMSQEEALTRPAMSRDAARNNRSNNVTVTLGDRTLTLSQWSRETGINYHTIRKRIRDGWTPERALHFGDMRRAS
jgi:hypothetical protein